MQAHLINPTLTLFGLRPIFLPFGWALANSVDSEWLAKGAWVFFLTYCKNTKGKEYLPEVKIQFDSSSCPFQAHRGAEKEFKNKHSALFNIILEARKQNKRHPERKGRSKTISVCKWHNLIYTTTLRNPQKKLELINEFNKITDYKIQDQYNKISFLYTSYD